MNLKGALRKVYLKTRRLSAQSENPRLTLPRLTLLNRLPRSTIGAEVGVWKGQFSSRILEVVTPAELHLVDPWEFQSEFSERIYGGKVAKSQDDMDKIYRLVENKFRDNHKVKIHRGYSQSVLNEFPDDYFDWIYIDGNHYYDYVLKDLELSFLKVKPGGMITGDDYAWGAAEGYPVQRAVGEFVRANKLESNLEVLQSQFIISL